MFMHHTNYETIELVTIITGANKALVTCCEHWHKEPLQLIKPLKNNTLKNSFMKPALKNNTKPDVWMSEVSLSIVWETKILYKMPVGGICDQASVDAVALPWVTWNSWHSAHPFVLRKLR